MRRKDRRMMRLLKPFSGSRRAASGLEYAVVVGLVGIVALSSLITLGDTVSDFFDNVGEEIDIAAPGNTGGGDEGGGDEGGGGGGDTTPPEATSVSLAGSFSGSLASGNYLFLKVDFSEPVSVPGTPGVDVALDALSGQSAVFQYAADSDSLVFRYNIPSNQPSYSSFSVTGLGAGVEDAAGNAASTSLPAFSLSGSFACVPPSGVVFTYAVPGSYTWTTPCGVTQVEIELWGAGTGGSAGGGGGGGGACELGGTQAAGSGSFYSGGGTAGGNSTVSKSSVILTARGGAGNDGGRPGGGGNAGHTTDGAAGGHGRGGLASAAGANTYNATSGFIVLANLTGNAGQDGQAGGLGRGGGLPGAVQLSDRGTGVSAGAGGAGGNGGSGGFGAGPNGFGKFGGNGGGGGGGAGGGAGGYLHVRDVPPGASLGLVVGAGGAGRGPDTTGGVPGINSGCDGLPGNGGFSGLSGQNGLVIIIPQ
jgi:Flp pilus assembly pilin Flp